ncbi:MAG: hypothetical protein LCH93_09020 [Proteobacteria bacterium]|nr:hypothetical protein [Pseudomonadota bacterium]
MSDKDFLHASAEAILLGTRCLEVMLCITLSASRAHSSEKLRIADPSTPTELSPTAIIADYDHGLNSRRIRVRHNVGNATWLRGAQE